LANFPADNAFLVSLANGVTFLRIFNSPLASGGPQTWFCSDNCALVVTPDNTALNGIVHTLDKVLLPAPYTTVATRISTDRNLQTFKSALLAASMTFLADPTQTYTIFAPSEAAFRSAFTPSQLACLADGSHGEALKDILSSHVVPSVIFPSFLLQEGNELPTLTSGRMLLVSLSPTGVSINGIPISDGDIFGINGVVHTVDTVMVPDTYDSSWFSQECSTADRLLSGLAPLFFLALFLY
jgi:transforming growth factor-beta-induced protein